MKLGVLGCGKMGSALARGIVRSGVCDARDIYLFDAAGKAAERLASEIDGAVLAESAQDAAESADVVLLCVKPGDIGGLLRHLAQTENDPLFLSIAAGVKISALESGLGERRRVVRAMPNTPALVGMGASAFAAGTNASPEDARAARLLLEAVGIAEEVPEMLLDAVTGLSGSGPAYVFLVIEALADGGVRAGLPRAAALRLAAQTVAGAGAMVIETGEHPAALRDQVTSPGGTTAAGLAALENRAARSAFIEAVAAGAQRSVELGT